LTATPTITRTPSVTPSKSKTSYTVRIFARKLSASTCALRYGVNDIAMNQGGVISGVCSVQATITSVSPGSMVYVNMDDGTGFVSVLAQTSPASCPTTGLSCVPYYSFLINASTDIYISGDSDTICY
jgi:hypothetical protein